MINEEFKKYLFKDMSVDIDDIYSKIAEDEININFIITLLRDKVISVHEQI